MNNEIFCSQKTLILLISDKSAKKNISRFRKNNDFWNKSKWNEYQFYFLFYIKIK